MRYIALLLLLATSAYGQTQYTYFMSPKVVSEATSVTFDGKNYASQMTVTTQDTINISAGWNTGQPYNVYIIASASVNLYFGTTIQGSIAYAQLSSGNRYLFTFTYDNSKWNLSYGSTINSILPIQTGNSGKFLTTNGTNVSWGSASAGTMWIYKARTTATFGYPGNGNLQWNNATQTSATKLALSHLTDDNTDVHILQSKISTGYKIIVQDLDAASNFQAWSVTGSGLDSSTGGDWWTFPVSLDSSGGTGTTGFTNNHQVAIFVSATNGGSGTVTSFSTSLSGLSVANATTTPALSGTLGVSSGGTGLTSFVTGDVVYATGATTLAGLPIAGSTGQYLKSTGSAPSWATPSVTTTTAIIDMSSPASQLVKDTALSGSGTLIHVSSKPTIPQFYYVVKAADIPTNTVATSYMAILTIGGKNRHTVSAVTVNWVAARGTNPATEFAASSSVSTAANNFWYMFAWFNSRGVVAGDTLSVKMWSSTIDTTDFRYATIYFIPRLISPPSGQFYFYGQTTTSTTVPWDYNSVLAGANAGVSYSSISNQPTMAFLDSATSSAVVQPNLTNATPSILEMVGNGQYLMFGQSAALGDTDNNSATGAAATLYQLPASNGTARRVRYLRKWIFTVQ